MIVSHSKVETFESCPYRYDLRYNQGIKTIPPDNADNALFLGTALHTGLEKDVQTAIHEYFMSYPVISDAQVNEAMKLEVMIPKAAAMLPPGEHEVKIEDDDFIGFIDLLAPAKTEQKLGGEHQVMHQRLLKSHLNHIGTVERIRCIQLFMNMDTMCHIQCLC